MRRQPNLAIRLQLFADGGGKVLDLVADEQGFTGYFPQAARGLSHRWAEGPAPRHRLTFFAVTLLEQHAAFDDTLLLDAWSEGDKRCSGSSHKSCAKRIVKQPARSSRAGRDDRPRSRP